MSGGYSVVQLKEVEGFSSPVNARWHMLRRELGVEAFGINAWTSREAGQTIIGEHDEVSGGAAGHEEVYIVLSGHATFTVDGETLEAPDGTVVFVRDPGVKRSAELTRDPEQAGVAYTLACAESRAGKADDAIRHLERAIALQASFADNAKTDPDFDPIREHAGFPA